ncbi:MAG: polyisoprenoid-binding protein [Winogradskyella sp.]|uniref:YceI family protein n=1 Tax=Winogradskyella sp. TaxID=1883156 RepID=UPI000F3E0BA2|nr:YceI family protein [Winogradskyella sp.]RNC87850.1 MAG: polyisoprenoid-binding protein [Winogradskyella sp.]
MKRSLKILFFFFVCAQTSDAQTKTYVIDINASGVSFNVSHLGVLNVQGSFKDFEGELDFKENTLSAIRAVISTQSIFSDDKSRDKTLRSESYLDVDTYPKIEFKSDKIEASSNKVSGGLTIKNETRPIVLSLQISKSKRIISLSTQISRKKFNLEFGSMNSLIGDIVEIDVRIKY